jgi:hypothetical protein
MTIELINAETWGVISEGLMMAVHPALMAEINGLIARLKG